MLVEHNKTPIQSISLSAISIAEVLSVIRPGPVTAEDIASIAHVFTVQQEETGIALVLGFITPQEARNEIIWATEYNPPSNDLAAIVEQPTMAQDIVAAELIGRGIHFHIAF